MYDSIIVSIMVIGFVSVVFGSITSMISRRNGYEGGFWWGFFLGWIGIMIVALRGPKQDNVMDSESELKENERFFDSTDGWECPCCSRMHMPTEQECACGFVLEEDIILKEEERVRNLGVMTAETEQAMIKKYKNMFEEGLITEEEFKEKKKQILGI